MSIISMDFMRSCAGYSDDLKYLNHEVESLRKQNKDLEEALLWAVGLRDGPFWTKLICEYKLMTSFIKPRALSTPRTYGELSLETSRRIYVVGHSVVRNGLTSCITHPLYELTNTGKERYELLQTVLPTYYKRQSWEFPDGKELHK